MRIVWKKSVASHWKILSSTQVGKKETLTEGTSTGDERASGLSANIDNVSGRRLDNYNLAIGETRGDGNCFFRAVSRMVYASDEYHLHVRSQAITYLSEHRDEFEGFITN